MNIGSNFTILDWSIVVGYLLIVVSVGVYLRRYISDATDFMVAGRKLRLYLGVATMVGTELGVITIMYAAQKGFTGGFAAFHLALACASGTMIVALSGFVVEPLRRMKVVTIPEFYEKRFGGNVRIVGGIILAFSGILNMGMYLKVGSLFITSLTGMESEVELKIIMTVLLAFVLLYTTLGGMVSVVVMDYIQFVVLSATLLFTSLFAMNYLGWDNIVGTVSRLKGESFFNPFHMAGFGVYYVIWIFFEEGLGFSIWQPLVLRACSMEDGRSIRKMYALVSIGFLIRFMLPILLGICAFVFVSQDEALKSVFLSDGGVVDSQVTLRAMPVFLSRILPAGMIGIFAAGMMAAFMSTHDSYLLTWSSVLTQDVVSPWFKKGLSSKTRLLLTRIFIVVIGLYLLFWGLWYPLQQDLFDYVVISGAIYFSGAIVVLTTGIYWKRASRVGAYLALITGFGAILGLKPVQGLLGLDIRVEIVGLWVVGIAALLMIAGSLLFPDKVSTFIRYKRINH